ncbi:MAG: caspase family protein [Hyphomonadaceae bacterium]
MERDDTGGNPFATALVEVLAIPELPLRDFGERLAAANAKYSFGWHSAEIPRSVPLPFWTFARRREEQRVALVLAVSDYSHAGGGVASLGGSRFDAGRVAEAFKRVGFDTTVLLDTPHDALDAAFDAFANRAANADVAAVYITGHGVQRGRDAYLILGDYPEQSARYLETNAVSLKRISGLARASELNLVFFSSCRDNPFSGRRND